MSKFIRNADLKSGMVMIAPDQRVLINGEVKESSAMAGFMYIETDFGVFYLDPDSENEIEEPGDEPFKKD